MRHQKRNTLLGAAALVTAAAVGYTECSKEAKREESANIKGGCLPVSPEDFTNIYNSSLKVDRSLTLEEKCSGSFEAKHFGSGVLLRDSQTGESYILTAEHVTVNKTYKCNENLFEENIKVKEGSLKVQGFPATVVKENEEADHALLKIDGTPSEGVPYHGKIAKDLKIGDYVIGVGYPDEEHIYSISNVKEKKEKMVFLNFKSRGGNSGGGLYRLSNQGLELIGTTRGGSAITSLDRLHELIQNTSLEDDYLQ